MKLISDYKNTFDRIKLVLLRTPMVVPKWAHVETVCPPLGLAYVAASLQQAGYKTAHFGKWHLTNREIKDAPLPTEYGQGV